MGPSRIPQGETSLNLLANYMLNTSIYQEYSGFREVIPCLPAGRLAKFEQSKFLFSAPCQIGLASAHLLCEILRSRR